MRKQRHLIDLPTADGKPRRPRAFFVETLDRYVEVEGDCWIWQRHIDVYGYGQVTVNAVTLRAHRAVYELLVERIPDGLTLDHLCRDTRCCNPDHLDVVPHAVNVSRAPLSKSTIYAKRTACDNGHPFTPENTSINRGGRRCKECHRTKERERNRAIRAVESPSPPA